LRLGVAGYTFAATQEALVVKHDDHRLNQITKDPVKELHGLIETDRRWSGYLRQRGLGDEYDRWHAYNQRRIRKAHQRQVRRLVAAGQTRAAWRYVRDMRPYSSWGRGFVAHAAAFAAGRTLLAVPRLVARTVRGRKPAAVSNKKSLLGRPLAIDRPGGGGGTAPPAISVVIPTYNRAELLRRAIDSALAQTYQDLELIVVDDGSTDSTAATVRSVADSRIRYIRLPKNRGVPFARNTGIASARGEWVAFLDCDDEWKPDKLERQLASIEAAPEAAASYTRCEVQPSNGRRRRRREIAQGDVTDAVLRMEIPLVPSVYMVKRRALMDVGGFDETMEAAEDADLWLRLAQAGVRFAGVTEPLAIKHHDHDLTQFEKDPIVRLRWFRAMDRRWGTLMKERLGHEYYQRWQRNKLRRFRRRHKKYVKRIARGGSRVEALRYVMRMLPYLSWGQKHVRKALTFAIVGADSTGHPPAPISRNGASR
jgi:glycosyltransferase involved in cell wall biosynthesis